MRLFLAMVLGGFLGAVFGYLLMRFVLWAIFGSLPSLPKRKCFIDPRKPCSPKKCECWDKEQMKRQQYLINQRHEHDERPPSNRSH